MCERRIAKGVRHGKMARRVDMRGIRQTRKLRVVNKGHAYASMHTIQTTKTRARANARGETKDATRKG